MCTIFITHVHKYVIVGKLMYMLFYSEGLEILNLIPGS